MRVGLALAILALVAPSRAYASSPAPGEGTRIVSEVGAGLYNATFATTRGAEQGRIGIDGPALRLRGGVGFAVARGLILGPSAGLDWAFTDSTREVCCGTIRRIDLARLGVEAAFYPDTRVGFRIHAGFGVAIAGLRPDAEGRQRPSALGAPRPSGVYFTAALARDYTVSARTRLGFVARIESDVLHGANGDHVYSLRSFTPSLSVVVLTDWPG